MDDHYGISHTLGLGDLNEGVRNFNNNIIRLNQQRLSDFQSGKNKEISDLKTDEAQQGVSAGVEGLSQYINKGEDIKSVGKAVTKLKGAVSGLSEARGAAVESVSNPLSKSLLLPVRTSAPAAEGAGQVASVGEDVAEGGISGAARVAGGALSIGLGAYDLADDISQGKVEGNNALERAGNIAQIGAGGLESAAGAVAGVAAGLEAVGMASDLTIAGAPLGLILGVAGGVAGLAAAGLSLVGGIEDDLTSKKQISQLTAPTALKSQAVIAAGSSGAEVKENIQGQ